MENLSLLSETISVDHAVGPDIVDITAPLAQLVAKSRLTAGLLSAACVGSTGSLTTIEFEPGVVADLKRAIEQLAPKNQVYAHEQAWHDGNGHSHVQAALLGPSIGLPIHGGRLLLGTWQQVVSINHDNRPRQRTLAVTLMGR